MEDGASKRISRGGMRIKFWGVRGSTPTPQAQNLRYGGNTSCVEVRLGGSLYIFDCGTGMRTLGNALRQEFGERPIAAHVFLSHFHWDHIQGLPFFVPLYEKAENSFVFHSFARTLGIREVLHEQMSAPYFPVGLNEMRAACQFYSIEEGSLALDGVTIRAMWLNHPQGCLGFRVESKEGIFVYATDNEPGDSVFDKSVRRLAESADILIYDAQYLPDEYQARKRGWGHSHWREAVDIAMGSGAKELILFHHDPDHDDACIDNIVREARNYYPKVRAASEGMTLRLGE
jgi:phosphoribosyl 1,2-cyclic phosphodiesterase